MWYLIVLGALGGTSAPNQGNHSTYDNMDDFTPPPDHGKGHASPLCPSLQFCFCFLRGGVLVLVWVPGMVGLPERLTTTDQ